MKTRHYSLIQKGGLVALLFLFPVLSLSAQIQEDELPPHAVQHEDTDEQHGEHKTSNKPKLLGERLKLGHFEFHTRSFFMATQNKGALSNYSTLATGAGIEYKSPSWKGLYFSFGGWFVFQVYEDNIAEADPLTGAGNRYEVLLYDMHNLDNTKDLDRLEELYLGYQYKNIYLKFGRQKFNSPLLNEQDNRMRPNLFSGISASYKHKNLELMAAAFTHATIRGTVEWYSMEESMGVYPFGRSPQGQPSQYKDNMSSKGLGILGIIHEQGKDKAHYSKVQAWNYTAENIFNLSFGQAEYRYTDKQAMQWEAGIQGFYQAALHNGGNSDPHKAYILPGEQTWALGGKLGWRSGRHHLSANYLGISERGRFLFPREWGREHFFASLARERFEGSGGVQSFTVKYELDLPVKGLSALIGVGQTNLADLNEYANNKYGVPSYYHGLFMLDYQFHGFLEGLDLRFLLVNKTAQDPSAVPDNLRINRVDMWNYNIILDYRF